METYNNFQTQLTDELLATLPQEVVEQLFEFINTVPFIRNCIKENKPRAKDLERDKQGRIIVDVTKPHILENQSIVSEPERQQAIIYGEGLKKWKPDSLVKQAMEYYEKFKPMAALILDDTRVATDKVRKFLRDIDLNATDSNGKPLYTLSTVVSAIDKIPALMKKLDEAEKALNKDLQTVTKMRGGAEKSLMEDSFLD